MSRKNYIIGMRVIFPAAALAWAVVSMHAVERGDHLAAAIEICTVAINVGFAGFVWGVVEL